MNWTFTDIFTYSMIGLLLLGFLLVAWRDLAMLVKRPGRGMGTGLSRVWTVARTTMLEAWAGRVWLLPVLWLVAVVILISVVRPFDEADRFPLYIRILLMGQEWLLLVMLWVMACVSLPKDRERKIVVTNASKPLSRLEMLLGKMVGFSVMAGLMLVLMGFLSWGILHVADYGIRRQATREYQIAETDYRLKAITGASALPPEDKLRLAQEGSLFAYNYVTVPANGMSIVGKIDTEGEKTVRWMKGGSSEKATYHFSPNVTAPPGAIVAPTGSKPHFVFLFPIQPYVDPAPKRVEINVSAVRSGEHLLPTEIRPQEKTIVLDADGQGNFEPDRPDELFTRASGSGERVSSDFDMGPVDVTVSCNTPGVWLELKEGTQKDYGDFNVLAIPYNGAQGAEIPEPHPIVRGFERGEKEEIGGPAKQELKMFGQAMVECAIFRFAGKDLRNIHADKDGNVSVSMALDVDRTGNYNSETKAGLRVFNDNARGNFYDVPEFTVIEKRLTRVTIPESMLGGPDPSKRGDLLMIMMCHTPEHFVALHENSVRLDQPESSFLLNLMKSEAILFCEAALLVVMGVTWSVRLGWPVAMLATFTCACFGYAAEFLASLPESGGLSVMGYATFSNHSATFTFFDRVTQGLWLFLVFLRSLLPDYTRYDSLAYITALRNMPLPIVGSDLMWTAAYAIPFIAIGYMLIRKQELG